MTNCTEQPLVSIVTCVRNGAVFLDACIDSVLEQDYDRVEHILIDDGSNDGSPEVIARRAAQDRRVRLFNHPDAANLGKVASRNLGIDRAAGEFVVFLDADDVLLPGKISHQARLLVQNPEVDCVLGHTCYWYSDTYPGMADRVDDHGLAPGSVFRPPELARYFLRDRGRVPCLCSPMIRLALIRRIGAFDDAIQSLFEDQVLLTKVFLNGTVLADDRCGEKYRQHPQSTSADAIRAGDYHPWRLNESEKRYFEWCAGYLVETGVDDMELTRIVDRALRKYRYPRVFGLVRAAGATLNSIRMRANG